MTGLAYNAGTTRSDPILSAVLMLVAVPFLTISALLLTHMGIAYEEAGGAVWQKVHPATMIAWIALVALIVMTGRPVEWTLSAIIRYPGAFFLLIGVLALTAYAVVRFSLPVTTLIDTFIGPVAILLLYGQLQYVGGRGVALVVHGFILLNAVIALYEFLSGDRLTPFVVAGRPILDDWRSTALLGHPLINSSVTGAYFLMLLLGGGRDLPAFLRPIAILLALAALIVFGGRTAFVVALLIAFMIAFSQTLGFLRGKPVSLRAVIVFLMSLPIGGLSLALLANQGFFDLFIERFIDDRGSAETRVEMLELFNYLDWNEVLLGPNPEVIETLQGVHGLEFGIESFWIAFILTYGLVPSLPFFAVLFFFLRDLIRASRPGAIWTVVFYLAVASASVGLSAKSPAFSIYCLMLLTIMRPDGMAASSPVRQSYRAPYRPDPQRVRNHLLAR